MPTVAAKSAVAAPTKATMPEAVGQVLRRQLADPVPEAAGVPVYQLLGGKVRDKVRSYAWIGGDRPHEIAEAAEVLSLNLPPDAAARASEISSEYQ